MIQYAYHTDSGTIRFINEDAIIYRSHDHNPEGFDIDKYGSLFAVADGMGGHSAGEIASNMACQAILKYYHLPSISDETTWDQLKDLYYQINENILMQSRKIPDFYGMGTTLTTLIIRNNKAWIAHVGDSRIYLVRHQVMDQITDDHTEVQKMVDKGFFTPQEAGQCRARNILTQAIGVDNRLKVFTWADRIQPGDLYLLCSDGLFDMLSNEDILGIIQSNAGQFNKTCRQLVKKANKLGGKDNISVILVGECS